jgi:endogenous inhibitor of DNA gyrase (YacG/DUF329 family)
MSQSYSLSPCPRCGYEASSIFDQTQHCPYCAENHRRIGTGANTLKQPTERYPTWKPEGK